MRLTLSLSKQRATRMWKKLWRDRGKFRDTPIRLPPSIQKLQLDIIRPDEVEKHPMPKWTPPVEDDPRNWKPMPIEEQSNYNEIAAHVVTPKTRFVQGLKQACILAKTQRIEGFPSSVADQIGAVEVPNQDMLVQRYIMQSQVWDPTMDKLPKRIDKRKIGWHFSRQYGIKNEKSSTILLRNMIRLCQSLTGKFPSMMTDRRLVYKPYLGTNYYFQNQLMLVQGLYEYLLTSSTGLSPFADEEEVDNTTTYQIPGINPISPFIDIMNSNCYTMDTIPSVSQAHSHSIPHTLFMLNKNYWNSDQRQARCLLFCLASALTQARKQFGSDIRKLPSPVSVQCVNMDPTTINFMFFQLNTADFTSSDGVKNMVWTSNDNHLFVKQLSEPWLGLENRETKYIDYDPEVFRRFMAVMMNGVPELQDEVSSSTERIREVA